MSTNGLGWHFNETTWGHEGENVDLLLYSISTLTTATILTEFCSLHYVSCKASSRTLLVTRVKGELLLFAQFLSTQEMPHGL